MTHSLDDLTSPPAALPSTLAVQRAVAALAAGEMVIVTDTPTGRTRAT
jgi:hypothetical protein